MSADEDLARPGRPLDHVLRAGLPWRAEQLTECGRPAGDVASVIDTDQLAQRVRRHGQQRTAFTVCMTCLQRAQYAVSWEEHPIGVLERELRRVGTLRPVGTPASPEATVMTNELRAIAALIAAHRDEFAGLLAGLNNTVSLADARANRKGRH